MEEQASSHIHTIRKYRVREEVGKWGNGEMGKWGWYAGGDHLLIYSFTHLPVFFRTPQKCAQIVSDVSRRTAGHLARLQLR